jgi:hypothetical protein
MLGLQFWELAREGGLLSRHTPLADVDALLIKACTPAPPVLERRQRVSCTSSGPWVAV